MNKPAKKTNFKLFRNEVTPGPDTEISGVSTMDSKAAAQQLHEAKYINIEKGLDPIMFYDLSGLLKDDCFINISRRFSVSQFHGVSVEVFLDSGFIECKKADFIRGVVTTGLLSLCIKGGVNTKGVQNTLTRVSTMSNRLQRNEDHLEALLKVLRVSENKKSQNFLRRLVAKHGNNMYGSNILHQITKSIGQIEAPIKFVKSSNPLSAGGIDRCEIMTKEPLTDKMYVVDDSKDDHLYPLDVNMSERFWGLMMDYKRVYFATGTHTQILRACTVTGMYCLSKWLLKSKICKDETNFYVLSQAIAKYGRDNF